MAGKGTFSGTASGGGITVGGVRGVNEETARSLLANRRNLRTQTVNAGAV
jgi:hypothetical protein